MTTQETKNTLSLHWLAVGYVSPGAQEWIIDAGGQVLPAMQTSPHLIAVGLAYKPGGAWVWSHGRQEHRQGVEFWSMGELQEASTGINLQYRSATEPHTQAEYCSAETIYLILPDEEFDTTTHQVKEAGAYGQTAEAVSSVDNLSDLDDAPF